MRDEERVFPSSPRQSLATSDRKRRVLLIFPDDGFANTARARALEAYLLRHGHDVVMEDTYCLSRISSRRGSLGSKLPALGPRRMGLYVVDAAAAVVRRSRATRRLLSYYVRLADCSLRSGILSARSAHEPFDLVICTTPHDAWVLPRMRSARTLYDCPTPWAAELHDDGKLTDRQFEKLREREKELFEQVDHLAFNWQSYGEYAVERYGITGRNLLTLNTGSTPGRSRAAFSSPPRIVYVGSLAGKAIDLPLLGRLSRLYPHIAVYGGPPPDPALGLDYRGYATSTEIMREYQIGLVGELQGRAPPVRLLGEAPRVPLVWLARSGASRGGGTSTSSRGSVAYDEASFTAAVDRLSDPDEWRRLSDEAYAQAQRLSWDETLRPLDSIVRGEMTPKADLREGAGDVSDMGKKVLVVSALDRFANGLISVLHRFHVKATFFMVGYKVERYPELVRRVKRAGHEIGNHSFDHPVNPPWTT